MNVPVPVSLTLEVVVERVNPSPSADSGRAVFNSKAPEAIKIATTMLNRRVICLCESDFIKSTYLSQPTVFRWLVDSDLYPATDPLRRKRFTQPEM